MVESEDHETTLMRVLYDEHARRAVAICDAADG